MEQNLTTEADLAALPVGSVILDLGPNRSMADSPVIACKSADGMWHVSGTPQDRRWRHFEVIRDSVGEGSALVCVYAPTPTTEAKEAER